METLPEHLHRVSAPEREATISRLQEAYIRGQLHEEELGQRIDRALSAVVQADLGGLVADLPALPAVVVPAVKAPWWRRKRPTESVYKSTVRKSGAWQVPEVFRPHVYKGLLIVDLRHAVLSAHDTTIELNAYKSRVAILVPVGWSIDLELSAYKGSQENLAAPGQVGAPRLTIRGSGYKSSVVVTNAELPALEG